MPFPEEQKTYTYSFCDVKDETVEPYAICDWKKLQ